MHGGEHNKRLSRLKWLLLDKLSRRCGFYPCNRSTWVPAPGIRNTKTGRGFEASRSCGMAVAMTFEREWHGSDMVTWWQWVMSWFGFTAWKYFTMYWFHGEIHLWHLGNKQPLCQLQKNSSTELKLQCGKASQTSCVLRENFPGKTYHEEGPARQSSNRFHMGENKPSARLIGVVHKHAAPSNPGWKTCTNIFMPLAGWVFLLHKLKHQLRPGLHWYADSFPAPGYRDTTPETLAYGNAMSQEMTLKTKHKWTPNPFLFSVWEGFWFRNLAMTGNPLRICHWYFWLCLQEYPPASQAPTYSFPWGSTNERGHKTQPVLHKYLAQFEITVNPFESHLFICDCHRLGLTYIAFKRLWVVVLQWISHDVQFCSKRKMGSSLRFYAQFLTLAPSMNKNLCSFCGCSVLNGVSVDFQQGFRGLDSSQLAFVSTHKQLCSFPAFDTFTPDHFASNFCGLIFRISNWQLTISSWLFGREHSFF